ncbi:hypothetical protein ASG11_11395 [Sphingomonas sp. Leaf357]|uniref:TadE/TadG family type IV pilus assembly protein n=1 Tax=Sphingomonas sp. Leaf357 TaxID=1736350 RepID=UPI0006F3D073|nr:TadE/TadG family type IV pilus assembly protein [Sphingomonas sp. Leaf357]KQS04781.1 hypothetical protein ASG11_11395 [Sphingomonas sp. Leaf357]
MIARLRQMLRDRRGATLVEFALVSPVMLLMLMGLGDLLYQVYTQAVLNGAVQKAARDAGIEGGSDATGTIDGKVVALMTPLIKNLTMNCDTPAPASSYCVTRKTYDTFGEVAPEPIMDKNGNGVLDPGECFTDVNGNGVWDPDPGITGQGGASAVTLYTMSITYPRVFPVAGLIGWSKSQTISSTTLLKNQPYASQNINTNATVCT